MNISQGSRLGPYEVVARIGAGGMGEVWRARDMRLDREVAIKVLPPSFASNSDRLHRFEQEARAAGSLNHPNLVMIHELGVYEGATYIVMELLEGETLRQKMKNERALSDASGARLPVRKSIDYATQIASGLAAAHEKGIAHRDLKPENIFVTRDGRVKILDFGLAKLNVYDDGDNTDKRTMQRDTAPGTVMGTAGYMSPEQVRGQQVDHRTDIFSFGAILYEMLSGQRAFHGDSSVETMNAILKDDPPELSSVNSTVSPGLDQIIRHCLEKNREERFQSARDLAFDLQTVSGSSASHVRAISAAAKPKRWLIPAVALVAAIVVIGALYVSGFRVTRAGTVPHSLAQRTFTQLTFQSGVESGACLAPDGKTFVYVSGETGKRDIFLQRVDGRNAINLTKDSPVDDYEPAFSPDGAQIAFRSEREGGGIFIMGATGESVRRLTDFGHAPAWSPDGKSVVVATELVISPRGRAGTSELWIIDVATGEKRLLTKHDAVDPTWSPHGSRIAFWGLVRDTGQRDIWTIDSRSKSPDATIVAATSDAPLDWKPVWSPDGKYLYFGSDRDATMNLWRIPIDEDSGRVRGAPEAVPLPAEFTGSFSFSRDGRQLAYTTLSQTATLKKIAFDPATGGTGSPTLLRGGALLLSGLSISPDQQWLATRSGGVQEDILLIRLDSGELRQITNDAYKDRGVSWSPDGKLLYFYSERTNRYELWSIRPDGSGLTQLTRTTKGSYWFPNASPDGRLLATYNDANTYLFDLTESIGRRMPMPLSPLGDGLRFAEVAWSPDGKNLLGGAGLVSDFRQVPGSWVYSLEAKQYRRVAEEAYPVGWLPDGKRVLLLNKQKLLVIDVATLRTTAMHELTSSPDIATLSHDGRVVVTYETQREGDVWLMTLGER